VFVITDASQTPRKHSIWQLRVETGTQERVGKPEQLTAWEDSDVFNLVGTTDGKRLTFVTELQWGDMYAGELGAEGTSMKAPRALTRFEAGMHFTLDSWTRDGQAILFDLNTNGKQQIFRQRPNQSVPEKLVDGRDVSLADMSPDGSWLLYLESEPPPSAAAPGSVWLMRQPSGGRVAERVLEVPAAEIDWFLCSSNPKASSPCVLGLLEGSDIVFYVLDPIRGKGRRLGKIAVVSPSWLRGWDFSPDGTRLAVVDRRKYGERIEVLTLADGTWHEIVGQSATQTPSATGEEGTTFCQVAWAADGKGFFVETRTADSSNLMHVTPEGKEQPLLANESVQNHSIVMPLPSPDGKYLAFAASAWDGNVWMMDNF
jgi:Tol biopolymer transport system component